MYNRTAVEGGLLLSTTFTHSHEHLIISWQLLQRAHLCTQAVSRLKPETLPSTSFLAQVTKL